MNDEQSKRLSEAADALLQARDAVEDARQSISDARFDSELERERTSAAQLMASKIETAAKRSDDAIRKGGIAAAACGRPGGFALYRTASLASREGRALGRTAADADGAANKRARGTDAVAKLDEALAAAARIVFVE